MSLQEHNLMLRRMESTERNDPKTIRRMIVNQAIQDSILRAERRDSWAKYIVAFCCGMILGVVLCVGYVETKLNPILTPPGTPQIIK